MFFSLKNAILLDNVLVKISVALFWLWVLKAQFSYLPLAINLPTPQVGSQKSCFEKTLGTYFFFKIMVLLIASCFIDALKMQMFFIMGTSGIFMKMTYSGWTEQVAKSPPDLPSRKKIHANYNSRNQAWCFVSPMATTTSTSVSAETFHDCHFIKASDCRN